MGLAAAPLTICYNALPRPPVLSKGRGLPTCDTPAWQTEADVIQFLATHSESQGLLSTVRQHFPDDNAQRMNQENLFTSGDETIRWSLLNTLSQAQVLNETKLNQQYFTLKK